MEHGFDCWGLVLEVFKRNGIMLPDVPYDTLNEQEFVKKSLLLQSRFERVESMSELSILEITVNGISSHVAVYIGNGRIIHAVIGRGVTIEPLWPYKKRIAGIYKVKTDNL